MSDAAHGSTTPRSAGDAPKPKKRRRWPYVVGLPLAALAVGFGTLYLTAFAGWMPFGAGRALPEGVEMVADGYVAEFMVDAGPGAVALIDCGNDPEAKVLLAALAKRGLGKDAVKAIFLTHGHPDHTAGCRQFAAAEVMAFEAEVPIIEGKRRAASPGAALVGVKPDKAAKVTRTLKDGETVTVGATRVRAFLTPGHTVGSASFVAKDTVFLGDNALANADGTMRGAPALFTDDAIENRRSLKALAKRLADENITVKALAFGHTGALAGLGPLAAY